MRTAPASPPTYTQGFKRPLDSSVKAEGSRAAHKKKTASGGGAPGAGGMDQDKYMSLPSPNGGQPGNARPAGMLSNMQMYSQPGDMEEVRAAATMCASGVAFRV